MNEMQIFGSAEFGTVRAIEKGGEPWFVAVDVCRAFGVANSRNVTARLDTDEKGVQNVDTPGGQQAMTIVSEAGLYHMLFTMEPNNSREKDGTALNERIEKLRKFKRWITHEVIPAIRKHGGYLTPQKIEEVLMNPDTIISLATQLKQEQEHRKQLQAKIEADAPYTNFGSAVAHAADAINVGDFAKLMANDGIKIGQKRLFDWLRKNGYLMNNNMPYQRYVEQGIFCVKENVIHAVNGDLVRTTTLITGKGQMYLAEKLRESRIALGA